MKANKSPKNSKRRAPKIKKSTPSGQFHPDEQTEILKACRKLSNILDPEELYAVFADVLEKKFAIHQLAIFHYRNTADTLELVFSKGLGELNFEIKKNCSPKNSGMAVPAPVRSGGCLLFNRRYRRGIQRQELGEKPF